MPQPVTSVTGFAMTHCKECGKRADVGSELSAAGGRGSEVSEWPRSKFPASAVRQRRNFGLRNRTIGPYAGRLFMSSGKRDGKGLPSSPAPAA